MITNPYKVLGVPDGSNEEECTKAYKRLAKKYHPDLNPNDKEAEKKMAEINAAYDQIKNGTTSANQYSYGSYTKNTSSSSAPDYLRSAEQFIKTGQYQQAINLLNNIEDRNARWYYLSALANMSLGNRSIAESHIKTAYAKEPNNATYQQAYQNIINGINPLNNDPFSSFFDFTNYNNPNTRQTTYTTRTRNGGCLSRILKIVFILIIIRLVLRLLFSVGYNQSQNYYSQRPTQSYSQQYTSPNSAEDYFGNSNNESYEQ